MLRRSLPFQPTLLAIEDYINTTTHGVPTTFENRCTTVSVAALANQICSCPTTVSVTALQICSCPTVPGQFLLTSAGRPPFLFRGQQSFIPHSPSAANFAVEEDTFCGSSPLSRTTVVHSSLSFRVPL